MALDTSEQAAFPVVDSNQEWSVSVLLDNEFYTLYEVTIAGVKEQRKEWKIQSPSLQAQVTRLETARDFFQDRFANWATLTATQKDIVLQQTCKFNALICRYLLKELEPGV